MTRQLATALAASASAGTAYGQIMVRYDWQWTEVYAGINQELGNPNGRIEPGEASRVSLTARIVPGIGSPVTYTAPPGPGVGTIAGLGRVQFDLIRSPGAGTGYWINVVRRPPWLDFLVPIIRNGDIYSVSVGQTVLPGTTANHDNPVVSIWRAVWTPWDYTPRYVTFSSQAAGPLPQEGTSVLVQYGVDPNGGPLYVEVPATGVFGSVMVQIGNPCYPNCDGSTAPPVLNVNDFLCFLNRYAAGDPYANCDGSTAAPVLNVNDFQCFLGRFAAGCP